VGSVSGLCGGLVAAGNVLVPAPAASHSLISRLPPVARAERPFFMEIISCIGSSFPI
jgi:hypothetical protein